VVLLPAITRVALAQERSGNVFVQAEDTDGVPLPGVTVELSGQGAPQLMVTGPEGQARFLKLDPGRYRLEASLEGFSTFEYPNVTVNVARNTTIAVQLSAAIEEVIVVTAESPLLDERKLSAGTTISQVELEKIPTARDPWAILSQAQGVMVDRINVGGSESGGQSAFRSGAQSKRENDFLIDGVQITDMEGGGSSTYYDKRRCLGQPGDQAWEQRVPRLGALPAHPWGWVLWCPRTGRHGLRRERSGTRATPFHRQQDQQHPGHRLRGRWSGVA
jgi:hypothetical protein